ncbi:nuclear transport factor 2 family protein [Curtobacterium sp. MCBD17_013]|uniref:nuclear transport factor 2 family protein n=1 Tax=unclassified Curtobacterium TaxID=257496 RepID=UPI000DA9309A|nr:MULTISPECIES: nuclear transport factor 2 family protein [unclassified Curtobacterium]PZF56917.1 nuclear transport factor 2 family protein [Curtobacterium sp. MCBD17_013]WIB63523.1 nuclear transport factor 2 family protein [Curtobacterium sp. MCBD17_040]
MASVDDLLTANLHAVFGQRDASARAAAAQDAYADDVVFTDPEGSVTGRDALLGKAAGLLDEAPAEFVFAEDGPRYLSGTAGALAWAFGPVDAPVARGIDVITVQEGRIATLLTILTDEAPPLTPTI